MCFMGDCGRVFFCEVVVCFLRGESVFFFVWRRRGRRVMNRCDETDTPRRDWAATRICKHWRRFEQLGWSCCGYAISKRWQTTLEPGGDDDMVCGLDVCGELSECSSDAYVNDCEGDCADEVTGVTLLRDDVAKHVQKRCRTKRVSRTGCKPIPCSWRDERWKYEADWSHVKSNKKGTDSQFAGKTTVSTRTLRDEQSRDAIKDG